MNRDVKPGDPCPFVSRSTCQPLCGWWDNENEPGGADRCSGFDMVPAGMSPRDFNDECVHMFLDAEEVGA